MKRTRKRVVVETPQAVVESEGLELNIVLPKYVADALRMRAESKSKTVEVYAAEILTAALASYI